MAFHIIEISKSGKLLINKDEKKFKKRVKELKTQKVEFTTHTAKSENPIHHEPPKL